MRWRLYIEEYLPNLRYVKGTNNVVADALSRLDMEDTPIVETKESFLSLMECFGKTKDEPDFHPLNYLQLYKAQRADKNLMKNLTMDKTLYFLKNFPWGRKNHLAHLF